MQRIVRKGAGLLRASPAPVKIAIMLVADLVILTACVLTAWCLRYSTFDLPIVAQWPQYMAAPFISMFCIALFGLYTASSRGYSLSTEGRVIKSQLLVPLIWALVLVFLGTYGFARSVIIIYTLIAAVVLVGLRRTSHWLFSESYDRIHARERIRVLIYGAGPDGALLADALKKQGRLNPVAFLDTDYTVIGRRVANLPVLAFEKLDAAVSRYEPREVLIAKPGQNRTSRRTMVEKILAYGLTVKTAPNLDDIVDGRIDLTKIREIRVEDLLGRDPVPPDQKLMEKAVKDRAVLITGAGGSIGSELVRQVLPFSPKTLVLFDKSEFNLFAIHREVEGQLAAQPNAPLLVAVLGDIQDAKLVKQIIENNGIEVIFHAAAYKHVRLVQENPLSGLSTNIMGTQIVAETAVAAGVSLFVLISTDKAVRPTSVMGSSKRVAEMIVQTLAAKKNHKTTFVIVRFGNVLGSSGSVVPLFRQDIEAGGPIRVTDELATRYFMLIPEAAQLVIQASGMADGGEVFVLDMGEPVRIVALAETMVELAGMTLRNEKNPDGDIEIKFIGLREGEKIHEELNIGRDITSTQHPRILRSNEVFPSAQQLQATLKNISEAINKRTTPQALAVLEKLITEVDRSA
jgi:UDP-N-acetylglucosamine 4,6-dehydratase